MMLLLALSALVAQAVPAAQFAPPLGRPVHITITELRQLGGTEHRYTIERTVTFTRAGDGYLAEVATLAGDGPDQPGLDRLAEMSMLALAKRMVVIELDRSGRVTAVRDRAAVWATVVDAMERAAAARAPVAERGRAVAMLAPFRAMPAERQLSVLGSLIAPAMGVDLITTGGRAPHPITTTMRGPDGRPVELAGTERSYRTAMGTIALEREAASGDGAARIRVTRTVDPTTGLAQSMRQLTEITNPAGTVRIERTVDIAVR